MASIILTLYIQCLMHFIKTYSQRLLTLRYNKSTIYNLIYDIHGLNYKYTYSIDAHPCRESNQF